MKNIGKALFCMVMIFLSENAIAESFVVLESEIQKVDMKEPWKSENNVKKVNLAVYLGDGKFLSSYQSVYYAKSITAQKFGDYQKLPLQILAKSPELNLVLLSLEENRMSKGWLKGLSSMKLKAEVPNGSEVEVVNIGQNLTKKKTTGRIRDVSSKKSGYGYLNTPMYSLDANLFSGSARSQAVLSRGELVGISSYIESGLMYVMPSVFIKNFVQNKEPKQSHLVSLGFDGKISINPYEREKNRIPRDVFNGIFVSDIVEGGPMKGVLKPGDLITHINGNELSYKGEVEHPIWKTIGVSYVSRSLKMGDIFRVKGWRNGKIFSAQTQLKTVYNPEHYLVPPYFEDISQHYFVVGGLVFHDLSEDYLQRWGVDWRQKAPLEFVHLLEKEGQDIRADHKIVILTHVLPTELNKGYHSLSHYILDGVNGVKIKSVKDLRQKLKEDKNSLIRFSFKNEGLTMVLDAEKARKTRSELVRKFQIPDDGSVF